jgi:hypothetical protein
LEVLAMEVDGIFCGHLVYFTDIWYFYGHLVHFVVIWNIFPRCTKRNMATLLLSGVLPICQFFNPVRQSEKIMSSWTRSEQKLVMKQNKSVSFLTDKLIAKKNHKMATLLEQTFSCTFLQEIMPTLKKLPSCCFVSQFDIQRWKCNQSKHF